MSVLLWIAVAILSVLAVLALMVRPRAIGVAMLSGTAAAIVVAMAIGLPHLSIGVTALLLLAALTLVLFRRNSVGTQRFVAFGSVAVIALGLLTGLSLEAFTKPQAVVTVAEGGNPASYPITNTATSTQVEASVRLASGNNNTPALKYYAYEAEAGTNNMGPAIHLNTAQDGVHRLGLKMVEDPLYASTIIEFRRHGANMSQEAAHQRAHSYAKDRQTQMRDSQALLTNIESAYLANFGATRYESLGMIPGSNPQEMPKLTKFSTQPAMEQVLVVKFKDGTGMYLRVACDLQPSLKQGFKDVPTPPTPERPPSVPPTTHVPPAPPSGGAPPPSTQTTTPSTTVPSTPKTTTPSTTTPSTTVTTTTKKTTTPSTTVPSTSKTTTPSTTTPSTTVTTTTKPCPPKYPDCKDPDGGPPPADGHTGAPAPSGEPETSLPVEPNPIDPSVPTDAPAPGVGAPGATEVPVEPRPTEQLPDPNEHGPAPSDPGTYIPDPDGQPAARMGAANAPVQEVPVQAAPAAEAQAPVSVAQPAAAPATAAESAPPAVQVTEVAPMSFNQQSSLNQGLALLAIAIIGGLLIGGLVRKR